MGTTLALVGLGSVLKKGKLMLQRTVSKSFSVTGIGLHSGKEVSISIRPSAVDSGIQFVRTDLSGKPTLGASIENVVDTRMATSLGRGDVRICTVEHLLAAFSGLGIDNAIVEVSSSELPVMDGSSRPFVDALLKAGVQTQLKTRKFLIIKRAVEIREQGRFAAVEPSHQLEVNATIEWDHSLIKTQSFSYIDGKTSFVNDVSPARTFGMLKDVEAMRQAGLAQGGSLNNAVVLDSDKVLNPEGLRFKDEFVRHKVLDALGDFMLVGYPILGKFELFKSGHELHSLLMREVLRNPANYELAVSVQIGSGGAGTKSKPATLELAAKASRAAAY